MCTVKVKNPNDKDFRMVAACHTPVTPDLNTGGGTSDGRFIAPTGAQVVELGPINASIHKVDEHVCCEDLNRLSLIYEQVLVELLATG